MRRNPPSLVRLWTVYALLRLADMLTGLARRMVPGCPSG